MTNPNRQRTSDVEFYDKLWFLSKLAVGTGLFLFSATVVLMSIITKDPYALVGLVFPVIFTLIWIVVWAASKLYNGGSSSTD